MFCLTVRPENRRRSESARSVREEKSADRPYGARQGSVSTAPPNPAAYGRTVSVQRSAGELITRATGAKQAIRPASVCASAAPRASSGRVASGPRQSCLRPAEACLTRISGTVSTGRKAEITGSSWVPASCSRACPSGSQDTASISLPGMASTLSPNAAQ